MIRASLNPASITISLCRLVTSSRLPRHHRQIRRRFTLLTFRHSARTAPTRLVEQARGEIRLFTRAENEHFIAVAAQQVEIVGGRVEVHRYHQKLIAPCSRCRGGHRQRPSRGAARRGHPRCPSRSTREAVTRRTRTPARVLPTARAVLTDRRSARTSSVPRTAVR